MRVYRLAHDLALQASPPFRPTRTTNRWNTDRAIVAYASESLALAALEMLTYWGRYATLRGYRIYTYDLEETHVEDQQRIAPDLDILDRPATQRYGDTWATERRSLALRVPSVVLPLSHNYLVNPQHPHFDEARIRHHGPLEFDARIQNLVDTAKINDDEAAIGRSRRRGLDTKIF